MIRFDHPNRKTVNELVDKFGVNTKTIRRDLKLPKKILILFDSNSKTLGKIYNRNITFEFALNLN